jgi:transcriptional regulator with XRE-family HTH domain
MNRIDKRVGRRIAELRKLAGLSQARLADSIGTATETISRLETGAAMPSLARLASIAEALGVELHELLRVRPGIEPQQRALERLLVMMARRTAGEIDLVIDIAALVLDHVRRYPGGQGREARS